MHTPPKLNPHAEAIRARVRAAVPPELVEYWDRRLLEGRPRDWT